MMMNRFDVCVIGAGVTGCAIARELSMYDLSVCVIEKEEDVCSGTSKANSGIVHAGYDAKPGSVKAKMNVRGSKLIKELSETLDFPYRQNGSMVVAFSEGDVPRLEELKARGEANGVEQLSVISGDEARAIEPALSKEVAAALLVPTGGIVCPFNMTIAFAENAYENGAEFRLLTAVTDIKTEEEGYCVVTDKGDVHARTVVNAAGVYADVLHNMVSEKKLHITARRGEYMLMDKEAGGLVDHTIFQLPTEFSKGVLVTPTVHGNLMTGPTATDIEDKEDTETTAEGLGEVRSKASLSAAAIPFNMVITSFSGLRAHEDGGDFVIGEAEDAPGFYDAAGIESPGLSSAPAIGEYLAEMIAEKLGAAAKTDAVRTRKAIPEVAKLPLEERAKLIAERSDYGTIICRCENISEGEIVDAIRRPLGARSLDGIKRRVRQGMGRCQAGFCTPGAMEILARELGIPMEQVCKNRPGSELVKGDC